VLFNRQGAFNQATHGVNFFRGNIRRPRAPAYEGVDARSCDDAQHSVEAPTDENITWEKWEQELFLAVLPAADGSILGKKYFESLAGQGLGDHVLMLMASVKCVPPGNNRASDAIGSFLIPQHQFLPTFSFSNTGFCG
jgi:hypothetical protein